MASNSTEILIKVIGVKVPCEGNQEEEGNFQSVTVNFRDDILFRFGDVCPIPEKFGFSLLATKIKTPSGLTTWDNEIATFMMASVADGFAPYPKWQNDVGDALFVRKDRKPLTPFQMEALFGFTQRTVLMFDDHEGDFGKVHEKMTTEMSGLVTGRFTKMFRLPNWKNPERPMLSKLLKSGKVL